MLIAAIMAAMGGPRVQLSNLSVTDTDVSTGSGAAQVTYALTNDGDVTIHRANIDLGGPVDVGDWVVPKAYAPGLYEARVTVTNGSLSFGTEGTWQSLSTTRSWGLFQSTSGSSNVTFTVEIRLGSTVFASATITLTATVS